jgi:hypothetical protein
MPHSADRFLTTHTGSLPRPDDLIQMMYAKEEGKPFDREALGVADPDAVRRDVDNRIDRGRAPRKQAVPGLEVFAFGLRRPKGNASDDNLLQKIRNSG